MGLQTRDGFAHIDASGDARLFAVTREQLIMSLAALRQIALASDADFDRAEELLLAPGEAIMPATSIVKW